MCMTNVPFEIFSQGLIDLIKVDSAWVPSSEGAALYIRPFFHLHRKNVFWR